MKIEKALHLTIGGGGVEGEKGGGGGDVTNESFKKSGLPEGSCRQLKDYVLGQL